jgi:hypothetical protein
VKEKILILLSQQLAASCWYIVFWSVRLSTHECELLRPYSGLHCSSSGLAQATTYRLHWEYLVASYNEKLAAPLLNRLHAFMISCHCAVGYEKCVPVQFNIRVGVVLHIHGVTMHDDILEYLQPVCNHCARVWRSMELCSPILRHYTMLEHCCKAR